MLPGLAPPKKESHSSMTEPALLQDKMSPISILEVYLQVPPVHQFLGGAGEG